jgi:hypothetical protein
MTSPLMLIAAFSAGVAVAASARPALRRAPAPLRTRYAAAAAALAGLVFVPSGLALHALAPDWNLMYLANPAHLPAPLVWLALVAHLALAPLLGFRVAAALGARPGARALAALGAALALAAVATAVGGRRALLTVAHYDGFHLGGAALPLVDSSLLLPCLLAAGAALAATVHAALLVRRHAAIGEALPGALDG